MASFPSASAVSTLNSGTSDASTWSPTMPAHVEGNKIIAIIGCDGTPTLSADASSVGTWTVVGSQRSEATGQVCGIVFQCDATANNMQLVVAATSAQEFVAYIAVITGANSVTVAWTDGNGTNSDATTVSPGLGTRDFLYLVARIGDGTTAPSGFPTSYNGNATSNNGNAGGCIINVHNRTASNSSENPAAWTVGSEQWCAATVAICSNPLSYRPFPQLVN